MTMELHPPINGESKSPHPGGGFEASRENRKKRRKERRADKERAHERAHAALEPLTIWVRSDPNHLQHPESGPRKAAAEKRYEPEHEKPAPKAETKPQRHEPEPEKRHSDPVAEVKPEKPAQAPVRRELPPDFDANERYKVSIPVPELKPKVAETAQPNVEDVLAFQDLPRLDIRPRHFYTETEVRQPHTTETEHDILPPTKSDGEPSVSEQPAPKPEQKADRSPTTAERLQELAAQKAWRAEELEIKSHDAPELPEVRRSTPNNAKNEHVRAIIDGEFESNTSLHLDELLEVADSVRLDGVSVAEMFRAERIDEEGLRRIIADFLRGQRIERAVAEEVLRQQMRFERDPQLRQVPLTATQDATIVQTQANASGQQRRVFNAQTMRRQADRIADRLADGIDRTVEAAENNPNIAKTVGTIVAVIAYFVVLILIIRS